MEREPAYAQYMATTQRHPLDDPNDGAPVASEIIGEIFGQMDAGKPGDDGTAGVREPRRPNDSPPALVAEIDIHSEDG